MLLMHTNHISRIQPHLEESIGNLQVLILTNNKIVNLTEIDSLIGFRKLDILSPLHSFIVYITIVLSSLIYSFVHTYSYITGESSHQTQILSGVCHPQAATIASIGLCKDSTSGKSVIFKDF